MAITVSDRPINTNKTEREDTISINGTTTLTVPSGESGATSTRWQIRRADDQKLLYDFTVDGSGTLTTSSFSTFVDATRTQVRLKLDRQWNYEGRTSANGGAFSDWSSINLTGKLRILGPRHRDSDSVTNTSRGATITQNQPKFTVTNTANGVSVTPNYSNWRKNRTF